MIEMKSAKCVNEIRHLFLNYNALMGKNRGGGGGTQGEGERKEEESAQVN